MNDSASRWVTLGVLSVVVWIVVYWWWEPGSVSAPPPILPTEPASARGEIERAPPEPSRRPGETGGGPLIMSPRSLSEPETRRSGPPSTNANRPAGSLREALEPGAQADQPESRPEVRGVEPAAPAVVRPRFRDYTVRAGDTFSKIAERELGSFRFAEAIKRANPFKDPTRIRPGDVVRIPMDPGNIQGVPAGSPSPTAEPGYTEYRVVSGDTLSGIATKVYGSSKHWSLIYDANRDQLRSPNAVRVGQTLQIPPAPSPD